MGEVPRSHPRYESLMGRRLLTDAAADGLLADSALIAHGRGEAFDYLLGEATCASARRAIAHAAAIMAGAERCVLSLNGNAVALAGAELVRCAAVLRCPIEVNIYYRTAERMAALLNRLESLKTEVMRGDAPRGWVGDWAEVVAEVRILGGEPDGVIPRLEGPRAACCENGILSADVIFVPLEDGDRCEALVGMGKQVIVVDLNPMSRSAKMASVTIVDELRRMVPQLLSELVAGVSEAEIGWNNESALDSALSVMLSRLK